MKSSAFTLHRPAFVEIFVYQWMPDYAPKAVVQIAHGLAEHAGRYGRLAEALTSAGYVVYANDHRGHGRTVPTREALGYFADHDGWNKCVDDLWQLNRKIAANHSGLPIVLLGHSMGSYLAQQFISEHGDALAGVILSGSGGKPPALIHVADFIAYIERLRLGGRGHSSLLSMLTFGAFNKPFEPARTLFDWLSRDDIEVDKYIADPLCKFPQSVQMSIDIFGGITKASDPARQARIPKQLPIYIIAGSRDPVSTGTKTLLQLLDAYCVAGIKNIKHKFYPEARHELFNEINRDEVTRDVLSWLNEVIA